MHQRTNPSTTKHVPNKHHNNAKTKQTLNINNQFSAKHKKREMLTVHIEQ